MPESWGLKDIGKDGVRCKDPEEKGEELVEVILIMTVHDIGEPRLYAGDWLSILQFISLTPQKLVDTSCTHLHFT